jgi:hypothetical protein
MKTIQETLNDVRLGIQKIQEVLDSDLSDEAKALYTCLSIPGKHNKFPDSVWKFPIDNVKEQQKTIDAMEELITGGYFRADKIAVMGYVPNASPVRYIYILYGIGYNIDRFFEPLLPYTISMMNVAVCNRRTPKEHQYILEHPEILRSYTSNGQPSLFSRLEGYVDIYADESWESLFPILFNRLKNDTTDKEKRKWLSLFPSLSNYLSENNFTAERTS